MARHQDLPDEKDRAGMSISCVIATHGDETWRELASTRALPSTNGQGFLEVIQSHLPNGTLAESRNAGAAQAQGEWLLFLDADDELAPGFADAMRGAVKRQGDSKPRLYTPAVIYARNATRPAPKIWPKMDFKVGNWCVIGTMIARDLFLTIGGFREYELYEDYALWAMAEAQAGVEVVEVPEAIYIAHFNRKSRNRSPGPRERFYWHQRIGRDVWPESFDALTEEEDQTHMLSTTHLRFTP